MAGNSCCVGLSWASLKSFWAATVWHEEIRTSKKKMFQPNTVRRNENLDSSGRALSSSPVFRRFRTVLWQLFRWRGSRQSKQNCTKTQTQTAETGPSQLIKLILFVWISYFTSIQSKRSQCKVVHHVFKEQNASNRSRSIWLQLTENSGWNIYSRGNP